MLDCLHGNGPAALDRQRVIADTCARVWGCDVLASPIGPAWVDALFSTDGRITAIAEIRARSLTLPRLQQMPRGYLVTYDKLLRGRDLAEALGVMFLLIVGLSDVIVWFPISAPDGRWTVTFTKAYTETQATCNGGRARRLNAFLSLDDMHVLTDEARC